VNQQTLYFSDRPARVAGHIGKIPAAGGATALFIDRVGVG